MDSIVTSFLSLPNIVITAIFAGIGGLIGVLIGESLRKYYKKNKLSAILPLLLGLSAAHFGDDILHQMKMDAAPNQVVQELKEELRVFEIIFRLHPEAEEEYKLKMTDVLNNSSSDQEVSYKSQAAHSQFVTKYLNKHMMYASDEMIYKLIQREAKVIASFQNKPQFCVSYYLGTTQFSKDDITPEFLNEDSNLKADLIESSISNPSIPHKAASIDEIANVIVEAYKKSGYDLRGLAKLNQVASLPPAEGCKIAIDFSNAIASMDQKQAAYVFKNLYPSKQQQ
jgi:hypothetical protein